MGRARTCPWTKMHRSRARSALVTLSAAPYWVDCITNTSGFDLRQGQSSPGRRSTCQDNCNAKGRGCLLPANRWTTTILNDACVRLCGRARRLKTIHELLSAGKVNWKYGAARFVRFRPQLAPMSVDDRAAYRQPHPRSTGLRGVKGGRLDRDAAHQCRALNRVRRPRALVGSCSVLINSSLAPSSTSSIAQPR